MPKVALVHEWLTTYGGSEKVVEQLLHLYPESPIYTLVHDKSQFQHPEFLKHDIHTSLIQSLPKGVQKYQNYLPLMPYAIEQFDLSGFDVIVSSSHAVAKGVRTRADQLHVSYVHSPIRYAWDLHDQYLKEAGLDKGFKSTLARAILHYIRMWDVQTANRVDVFAANSRYIAQRIWRVYRRKAKVIYPPVDVERFAVGEKREDFYLTLSRLVPYKKIDVIVEAFSRLGLPLVVIGDGPEREKITALAGQNITFLGRAEDQVCADYLQRCKAFVFAADEDFGISPVEAQAAGAPVIAYGKGGSLETVKAGETGLFFGEQTVESLIAAIQEFQNIKFDPHLARKHAETFSNSRFLTEMQELMDKAYSAFISGADPEQAILRDFP